MLTDLICALATPAGRSAISVVRLSGRRAIPAALRVLDWPADRAVEPRHAYLATFHESDGSPFDQGLVTFFPGPGSFTGEDLIEFACHGGVLSASQLIGALLATGARTASPGEFTRRAVCNGKLDLLQAEAIADLVDATTRAQGRVALHQLEGGLSRRLNGLREALIDLQALLAYDIDFPEEDDGPVAGELIERTTADIIVGIEALLATAGLGERVRRGALVVIAGRPNVGKSSLFNALLGSQRALVTEMAGTTRDAIEADLDVDGYPVRVVDTAGLRPSEDRIEQMGIEMSRRYLGGADLVLLCVEAGAELTAEERSLAAQGHAMTVRTKADLRPGFQGGVSVVSGAGLAALKADLIERLYADGAVMVDGTPLLTRERHRLGLLAARDSLREAAAALAGDRDVVLVAHHVRRAVVALDELLGAVDVDEVFGRIFERFCVGK